MNLEKGMRHCGAILSRSTSSRQSSVICGNSDGFSDWSGSAGPSDAVSR